MNILSDEKIFQLIIWFIQHCFKIFSNLFFLKSLILTNKIVHKSIGVYKKKCCFFGSGIQLKKFTYKQLIVSPYSTQTVCGGQGLNATKMVQLSAPLETAERQSYVILIFINYIIYISNIGRKWYTTTGQSVPRSNRRKQLWIQNLIHI